jgi:putative ABC transport system ATP-binding protein
MSSPLIELERVSRIYQMGRLDVPALDDVSLRIDQGEFVAIVGPSGSGKSTMMNILGCLDRPTLGSYRLAGTPVGELDDDSLARLRSRTIGFVFQSYNLLPRTSAIDNVATPLLYQGVGRNERQRRARTTLERRTVVLITHDADVAAMADRQIHLLDGRISDGQVAA